MRDKTLVLLCTLLVCVLSSGCKSLHEKVRDVEMGNYEYSVTDQAAILAVHGAPDHIRNQWRPNPYKAYPGDPSLIRYEVWRYQPYLKPIADYIFTFKRGYLYDWIIVYPIKEMPPGGPPSKHEAYYELDQDGWVTKIICDREGSPFRGKGHD